LKGGKIRRDQLYSITKDKVGSSVLSRFHEKGGSMRTDASIEKEYLDRTMNKKIDQIPNLFSGFIDFPE
jgi:hypothetical protein